MVIFYSGSMWIMLSNTVITSVRKRERQKGDEER